MLPDDLIEGHSGDYFEKTKHRLVTTLLNYTEKGTIIFDLQAFDQQKLCPKDVMTMIRDALMETKCTWHVHLVVWSRNNGIAD